MHNGLNRIWDPLYGLSELSPFESRFVFSPEVQRLRHVRLCNIDSLLIPGASNVTRFEHALGVLRLANEWIRTHEVAPEDANDLRAAALIHDIQSGPFGHSIQYVFEDNHVGPGFSHEDLAGARERHYHQSTSANSSYAGSKFQVQALCGDRWDRVSQLIVGQGALGPLISGAIDLDNIDNVIRLASHVGICERTDGLHALQLVRDIIPSSTGLVIPINAVPIVRKWQEIRKRLYEFLLLDWAEFSAKAMLTRAFEDAVSLNKVGIDSWLLTDDELIQQFLNQVGDGQDIKEIARRLRLGQLYSPVLLGRSNSINMYRTLNRNVVKRDVEKLIRKAAYQDRSGPQLLVHFILDVKKTERAIRVGIRETSSPMVIGGDSRCLLIGVFASTQPTARELATLRRESVRVLSEYGCAGIEPVDDPLIAPGTRDSQLGFLNGL